MRTSRRMLKQVRRALVAALAFSSCISLLMLATPLYALQVFQAVLLAGRLETVMVLTLITAAAIATLAILEGVRDAILLRAGLWLDHNMGEHILRDGLTRGAPATELTQDAEALQQFRSFLTSGAAVTVLDAPWVPAFLCVLALIHPMIGAIAIGAAGLLLGTAFLQIRLTLHLARLSDNAQERSKSWILASAGNTKLASALGLTDGLAAQWERVNRPQIGAMYAIGKRTGAMTAFARLIPAAAQVALFGAGGWLVTNNELSPAALVASVLLLARALAPLAQVNGTMQDLLAACRGYQRLKALPVDAISQSVSAVPPHGVITLTDVTYYHPGRSAASLQNVSLSLQPGECLVISGPNGSGKSTLAAIIAGAAVPAAGVADLDGFAIAKWQRATACPPIGYVPDEPMLLEGSVHENIARFQDASSHSVAMAAHAAGVHDSLANLPGGFDTLIGPGGSGLSLRDRRSVALARAAHGTPRVLVLDEPEMGLDQAHVRKLITALQALKDTGTSLVIATQDPRFMALGDHAAILNSGVLQTRNANFDGAHRLAPLSLAAERSAAVAAGAR